MGLINTRISATKTVNNVTLNEEIVYDWSIEKTASPTNITYNFFGFAEVPVNYRLTADRFVVSAVNNFVVSGSVCVANIGNNPTIGLTITDEVQFRATPGDDFTTIAGPFALPGLFDLEPGEIACFPYEISFADQGNGEYRNFATVGIANDTAPVFVTADIDVDNPDTTNFTTIDETATIESDQIIQQPGGFLPGAFIVFPPVGVSFPIQLAPIDAPQVFTYTRTIFKNILTFVEGDVINEVILREDDSGEVQRAEATVSINTIFFGLTGDAVDTIQSYLPLTVCGENINNFRQLEKFAAQADKEQLRLLKEAFENAGLDQEK